LFDENNEPLYACGAAKNGRRYRYYVSRKLVRCSAVEAGAGWRLAGPEIERSVVTSICFMLNDAAAIAEVLERAALSTQETAAILTAADHVASESGSLNGSVLNTLDLVNRIGLRPDGMEIRIDLARLLAPESHCGPPTLIRFVPLQIRRRGVELRLVVGGEACRVSRSDPALVKAVIRGYQWFNELCSGSALPLLR